MVLVKKIAGFMQVGLLGLTLLAGTAWSRTNIDQVAGLSVGIRGGGILPSTDLDGKLGPHGAVFMRYGLMDKLQGELGVGYGRFITEDTTWVGVPPNQRKVPGSMSDYMTHLSFVQLRLVFAPVEYEKWNPFLYGGAGYTYFNVEDITPRRGSFDGIGSTLGIPLGLGVRYELAERWGLEGSAGYTFTFSDRIDERDDGGGNDNYWEMTLGLTYDITLGRAIERVAPPPPPIVKPEVPVDQDGDGLTDDEEKKTYFTNPLLADSDGDGLNDGDEVRIYRTNPNKFDTDDGGIGDGDEIRRGTDPLAAADDLPPPPPPPPPVAPPVEIAFPVVYFPTGGAVLSAEAKKDLDKVAKIMQEQPKILLDLRGHADNTGAPAANLRLSRQRAEAVKDYLVKQGIASWRITSAYYGDTQPAASNATPEGRRKNRRVELVPVQ